MSGYDGYLGKLSKRIAALESQINGAQVSDSRLIGPGIGEVHNLDQRTQLENDGEAAKDRDRLRKTKFGLPSPTDATTEEELEQEADRIAQIYVNELLKKFLGEL